MKRCVFVFLAVLCSVLFAACAQTSGVEAPETTAAADVPVVTPGTAALPSASAALSAPEDTPQPSPTPTQPPSGRATVGAVGDIMVVRKHLDAAQSLAGAEGSYDFSFLFPGVTDMFRSIDLMCGNLEGTLPGPNVDRYSSRQIGAWNGMRFGSPDLFAETLKDAGFDFLTTANNHTADYGADGIISTIDVLDRYGLYHAGTFRSAEERTGSACVVEVNGIRIGLLAATTLINEGPGITEQQRNEMVSRLQMFDLIQSDIQACRDAGAEFIIMFAHWDTEYTTETANGTRIYARNLLAAGVDAIVGSHPHIVQPFAYETVTRADGTEYTGLVAYSLGNFLTNMDFEYSCGTYLQFELVRGEDGKVTLSNACYSPVYCLTRYEEDTAFHQMIPALSDPSGVQAFGGVLDEREQKLVQKARNFVTEVCGTEVVPLMEDVCWIS